MNKKMKKIILFDPSNSTMNMGDYIISMSAQNELKNVLKGNFVINVSVHNPITHFYQNIKKRNYLKFFREADYKFVLGSNIINPNMLNAFSQWNINIVNCLPAKNSILVGAGLNGRFKKPNLYTKMLLRKVLDKETVHSVRDDATKKFINALGLKAINTGCPTMWILDKDFCKNIPTNKSNRCIFTLTDYRKDREKDQQLIRILKKHYRQLYFWVQGDGDLQYFSQLEDTDDIIVVPPSIEEYEKVLNEGDIDYIGTRLHAGIFALRHKVRTIIIQVDNRTKDIKETYNLIVVEREKITDIEEIIVSSFKTDININIENIRKWKEQFD